MWAGLGFWVGPGAWAGLVGRAGPVTQKPSTGVCGCGVGLPGRRLGSVGKWQLQENAGLSGYIPAARLLRPFTPCQQRVGREGRVHFPGEEMSWLVSWAGMLTASLKVDRLQAWPALLYSPHHAHPEGWDLVDLEPIKGTGAGLMVYSIQCGPLTCCQSAPPSAFLSNLPNLIATSPPRAQA